MRKLTALALVLALGACATPQLRPGIPDTPRARTVVSVLEEYRHALESQDLETLMALASTAYHDDMGTPEPDDDVTYEDLRQKLEGDLERVSRIRLDMEIIQVEFPEEQLAEVDYRYDVRYQLKLPSGEKWHNALDVNRMVLRLESDTWRITTGL